MTNYDIASLLRWEKSTILRDVSIPLYKDRSVTIEWNGMPRGCAEEARNYLETTFATITDQVVAFNTLSGIYRFSKLDYFEDDSGVKVQAHYRASFYTAWDWTRVELGQPARYDYINNFVILRHRHIDPTSVLAFLSSAPLTWTNQASSIGTFSGTWVRGRIRMLQDDDGSAIAMLYAGKTGINVALYGDSEVYSQQEAFSKSYTDYYFGVTDPNGTGLVIGLGSYVPAAGYTFKKTVSRNDETCLYDVTIEKVASVFVQVHEQSNHSGFLKNDLFQTIVVNKSKNEATRPDLPDFSDGTIIKQSSSENEFGVYDNEIATITASPVSSVTQSGSVSSSEKTSVVEDRNQTSAATIPTSAGTGTSVRVIVKKNEFGLYDNESETSTAVPLDSGWIAHTTEYGTSYSRSVENYSIADITTRMASVTPPALVTSIVVTPTKFQGLWSAHINAAPPRASNPPLSAWSNFQTNWMAEKHYTVGNKAYKCNVTFGVIQSNSPSTVTAFLDGSGNPHFESINGGKHFRGTYATITSQPELIT